jgi:hypothetical protein
LVWAVGREWIIQKPTTVWQPWVFVEISVTLDKHQRHRQLRRLRRQPVELLATFEAENSFQGGGRQALSIGEVISVVLMKRHRQPVNGL